MKIELNKNIVLVESALSSSRVQELIESTGRKAVLLGVGVEQGKLCWWQDLFSGHSM